MKKIQSNLCRRTILLAILPIVIVLWVAEDIIYKTFLDGKANMKVGWISLQRSLREAWDA